MGDLAAVGGVQVHVPACSCRVGRVEEDPRRAEAGCYRFRVAHPQPIAAADTDEAQAVPESAEPIAEPLPALGAGAEVAVAIDAPADVVGVGELGAVADLVLIDQRAAVA